MSSIFGHKGNTTIVHDQSVTSKSLPQDIPKDTEAQVCLTM